MKKFILPAIISALFLVSCGKESDTNGSDFNIREDAIGWWHATSGDFYDEDEDGKTLTINIDSVWVHVRGIEDGELVIERWFNVISQDYKGMNYMVTGGAITSDTEAHSVYFYSPDADDDEFYSTQEFYYVFDWKMTSATSATYESHALGEGKEFTYEYYTLRKLPSAPAWYSDLQEE